jgi:hypothetical protein
MLEQAGELSMEIQTILHDMNGDLRKLKKTQMIPANRRRIARSLKHLVKFNNQFDKATSIIERASLADAVDDLEVEFNSLKRSRDLVQDVLKYPH